jgi:hypothetical protein
MPLARANVRLEARSSRVEEKVAPLAGPAQGASRRTISYDNLRVQYRTSYVSVDHIHFKHRRHERQ